MTVTHLRVLCRLLGKNFETVLFIVVFVFSVQISKNYGSKFVNFDPL